MYFQTKKDEDFLFNYEVTPIILYSFMLHAHEVVFKNLYVCTWSSKTEDLPGCHCVMYIRITIQHNSKSIRILSLEAIFNFCPP
jgi:hypothetical protein